MNVKILFRFLIIGYLIFRQSVLCQAFVQYGVLGITAVLILLRPRWF